MVQDLAVEKAQAERVFLSAIKSTDGASFDYFIPANEKAYLYSPNFCMDYN